MGLSFLSGCARLGDGLAPPETVRFSAAAQMWHGIAHEINFDNLNGPSSCHRCYEKLR